MKKLKYVISALAVSVMAFGSGFSAHALDYCGSLTYIVSGNGAVITGYKGSPEVIDLPSQIDGVPVTEIRENAFYKCGTLKKIVIPESVSKIGNYAFFECTSLETAEINAGITAVPEGAFYGCESLENISLNTGVTAVEDYAFFGCRSIEEFDFPVGVTDIGAYSFAGCTGLNEVKLSGKLKNIEPYSFYNCESLDRINLPESLLSIGQYAIGFSDSGVSETVTITGISDSIAEYYADSSGVKFKSRIYYENSSIMSEKTAAGLFGWLAFAIVYALLMCIIISKSKQRKQQIHLNRI